MGKQLPPDVSLAYPFTCQQDSSRITVASFLFSSFALETLTVTSVKTI